MAQDRTREYRITVNVQNLMSSTCNVTKTVYERELKAVQELVEKLGDPSIAQWKVKVFDRDEYTTVTYTATFTTHMIEIATISCKEGYQMKERGRFLKKGKGKRK